MTNKDNIKFTTKVSNYFKGVRAELRKVNWPTKKELKNYTIVVFTATAALTIVIWGLDFVFRNLVSVIV